MQIQYGCTYWGSDALQPRDFVDNALAAGYSGVEVLLQPPDPLSEAFVSAIGSVRNTRPDFFFIPMQITFPERMTVDEYVRKMLQQYAAIARLQPDFINAHTGRDYYSFDDNCRIIEAAQDFGVREGIRIVHETHRGRFSFHAAGLLPYLQRFPELELAGDLSHFCTVSESMLGDQEEILALIFPHITHIHARVGFEQGPQVNDPAAPEWQGHLERFVHWWEQIINIRRDAGQKRMTITPEFGPAPYMPAAPYTREPLSNQWHNNVFMMERLRLRFKQ